MDKPLVGIIMGSDSDLDIMSQAAKLLDELEIKNEVRVVSAHRTPDEMTEYARSASDRGLKVIIAGAGGSAHLPGIEQSEPAKLESPKIRRSRRSDLLWLPPLA